MPEATNSQGVWPAPRGRRHKRREKPPPVALEVELRPWVVQRRRMPAAGGRRWTGRGTGLAPPTEDWEEERVMAG